MLEQIAKVYALFIEITGVKDVRKLEQAHLAQHADTLAKLPAIYRKSPRERRMTIVEIIAARSGEETLSASTINKNLDLIGQLLTKARSEGFENVILLDLNSLRPRKTSRARDERPAFTAEDVQRLFQHPLWQGNLRRNKWRLAGPHIDKTGHYWLPLIAAMTGARREEIAALKVDDIEVIDGIPALHIRANANRGLKTSTSTRTIPLHPQLIELGLLTHLDGLRARKGHNGDLFPDLRPKAKGGSYGQAIDYRFCQLVGDQLGEGTGKVFHSFRHYVATQLGLLPDGKDQTCADILGHVGGSITAERYSKPTPLPIMLAALSQLPPLPIKT